MRVNPRHRRLAAGGLAYSSSSSESKVGNSIDGKAIESSSCCEASTKTLISKDPMVERDRLSLWVQIIGLLSLTIGNRVSLRDISRASVAGEMDLVRVVQDMFEDSSVDVMLSSV